VRTESVLVAATGAGLERRLRRVPWGIEVQIWRLVETQTYPESAANLSLCEVLGQESTVAAGDAPVLAEDLQMALPWRTAP
jgi:hypothetical protein